MWCSEVGRIVFTSVDTIPETGRCRTGVPYAFQRIMIGWVFGWCETSRWSGAPCFTGEMAECDGGGAWWATGTPVAVLLVADSDAIYNRSGRTQFCNMWCE